MIGALTGKSSAAKGLPSQLEGLAAALEHAEGRLDEQNVVFGRHVLAKADERLRHGTTSTLVALLGATGSGKSSVTNALVGSDVATAGIRRPTTSSTLSCYWREDEAGSDDVPGPDNAQGLLDWLEIKNRHEVADKGIAPPLSGLVLLDVPDHDSVAVEHRMEMERIAEHADLLLWVTDAEKYADKAMHDYLRRLGEHGAVTAMVLNKADLLSEADVKSCVVDLKRLLADDGLPEAPVVAISATTGQGVPELRSLLAETVSKQQATVERLAADTRTAAAALLDDLGANEGSDKVPDKVAKRLASDLVGASGLEAVCDAVAAGHRRDASSHIGWPFTRWARKLRPHPLRRLHLGQGTGGKASLPQASGVQRARSESAVRDATTAVSDKLPDPWPELIASAATPDQATLNNRIEGAIAGSVRAINTGKRPAWWLIVNSFQVVFALAAIGGAIWLALLAFGAYLRLPDVPTPTDPWIDFPIPTDLLIGGLLAGFLLWVLARRFAAVGGKRRARVVRKEAEDLVREISDELVIEPMNGELGRRNELRSALLKASGGRG